jgi:hypothetical protein
MSGRLSEAAGALEDYRRSKQVEQPDLFSAIESVAEHAGGEWRDHALEVVRNVACSRELFTVEDVAPLVGATIDRRALGAVMLTAKRRGWIQPEGYVNAGAERHAKPIRQWRSQLYPGAPQ